MIPRPPTSTRFPYTTLFRSSLVQLRVAQRLVPDDYTSHLVLLGGRCKDRKSTRLNSSHVKISYAVFCLKKKNKERYKCDANGYSPSVKANRKTADIRCEARR